jgi:hypothetical protein
VRDVAAPSELNGGGTYVCTDIKQIPNKISRLPSRAFRRSDACAQNITFQILQAIGRMAERFHPTIRP